MAVKHFLVNPNINPLSKQDILELEERSISISASVWSSIENKSKQAFDESCNLKHTFGRVIVKIDLEKKNYHTFENGTVIRRERNFNEFNRRITQPVNAIVISGENIESGSEILISHNSTHDTNRIFSYKTKSPYVQYFSVPEYDCFAWRDNSGVMQPMQNFDFGLRVYKPYTGHLSGLPHELIKDVLYITTGEFKGKVVHTLSASDYTIIYQDTNGREAQLIRVRHSTNENFDREEIIAISGYLTGKVLCGTLLVGLTEKDCKKLN